AKIQPLSKIDPEERDPCPDLIYDRRREGYDPLARIIESFSARKDIDDSVDRHEGRDPSQRLARRIVDGGQCGCRRDLDEALGLGWRPLDIINDHLLAGMKVVGDLFASGEMQLPFVLKSAETMKRAVAHLEPKMERTESVERGSIVLATVAG